jgi:hypothetical protein
MNAPVTPQTLHVEELLQAARERAPGLKDFGNDNYQQALEVLTRALNTEAKLSATGIAMMRERLVGQLVNRLLMEDYLQRFPKSRRSRSKTLGYRGPAAHRHHHAAANTGRRPALLLCCLVGDPLPCTTDRRRPAGLRKRITMAKAEVAQTIEAIPQILSIHPMSATLCDEEFMLMEHSFLCAMDAYADVPSYTAWLDQQDQRPVYTQLKKMLQFLQWQKSQRGEAQGQRWLLKAPQHLHTLEILLSVFPQAQVILTHREPAQTIPSMASMAHTLWQIYSDQPDPSSAGRQWNSRMARGIHHTMQVREQQDSRRFLDIHFSDTVAKPMEVLEAVYQFAQMPFTEKARTDAQQWLSSNGREKRAGHDYSLETFGLSEQQMQRDYALYRSRHLPAKAKRCFHGKNHVQPVAPQHSAESWRQSLMDLQRSLQACGASRIRVMVVDDAMDKAASQRITFSQHPLDGMISLWLDSASMLGPVQALIAQQVASLHAYLVCESEPYPEERKARIARFDAEVALGKRTPGMCQVALFRKPVGMNFEEWMVHWREGHGSNAYPLQSIFGYRQNLVVRR